MLVQFIQKVFIGRSADQYTVGDIDPGVGVLQHWFKYQGRRIWHDRSQPLARGGERLGSRPGDGVDHNARKP